MRVFFNHLSKCGGTSVNQLAKEQYGNDFHVLHGDTTLTDLQLWLEKEDVFITSEINTIKRDKIIEVLQAKDLKKILLGRDPVKRFKSFAGHSTRTNSNNNKSVKEVSFWGLERHADYSLKASDWMNLSLTKTKILLTADKDYVDLDMGLYFSIYSQWYLASFKGHYDFESKWLTQA